MQADGSGNIEVVAERPPPDYWVRPGNGTLSGDFNTAANWSLGVVPAVGVADAVIEAPGSYTVTVAAGASDSEDTVTLNSANATLAIAGTFAFGGADAVLELDAGTTVLTGLLKNGTIAADGGKLIGGVSVYGSAFNTQYYPGTLESMTVDGPLTLSGQHTDVLGSLILRGADGAGPGSLDLANDEQLYFSADAQLDTASVTLDPLSAIHDNGHALTFGTQLMLDGSGGFVEAQTILSEGIISGNLAIGIGQYGFAEASMFDNTGSIVALATTGYVEIQAGTLDNSGRIEVANNGFVFLETGSFDNGGRLTSAGTFDNSGTIAIDAGGTLALDGYYTLAELTGITRAGGGVLELLDYATLDLGGGTLDLSPNGLFGNLVVDGTIENGTILTDGGTFRASASLSNVTLDGDLLGSLNLYVENGFAVNGANGTGIGTIDLSQTGDSLDFEDNQTLSNALVLLGNDGTLGFGGSSYPNLYLAAGTTIDQTAGTAVIGGEYQLSFGTLVADQGSTIELAGTATDISVAYIASQGMVVIGNGDTVALGESEPGSNYGLSIPPTRFDNIPFSNLVIGATLDSNGQPVDSSGTLDVDGTLNNDGDITIRSGGLLDMGGGTLNLEASGYGYVELAGALANAIITGASTLYPTASGSIGTLDNVTIDTSLIVNTDIANAGTVTIASGGSLDITGNVSTDPGSRYFDIASNAVAEFGSAVDSGETIDFTGAGTLVVDDPSAFAGTIEGFGTTELIDVPSIPYKSPAYPDTTAAAEYTPSGAENGLLQVFQILGTASRPQYGSLANFNLIGKYPGNGDTYYNSYQFNTAADPNGGTEITDPYTYSPPCFCPGTMILTPDGELAVEALKVGDLVTTLAGETRPIAWIGLGHATVTSVDKSSCPIIVRRDALAEGVPNADLYLTAGHALYVEGVLVPVGCLVNDRSILRDERPQVVEFYHIELAGQDVLLANGAPAESYCDEGNRIRFQNADGPQNRAEGITPYAPVWDSGDRVARVALRLRQRAGIAGLTDDPDLHLLLDGGRLDPVRVAGAVHHFRLPQMPADLRIASRRSVPVAVGIGADARSLGVAVQRLVLRQGEGAVEIGYDAAWLRQGFHRAEPEGGLRWTDGEGVVPEAAYRGLAGPCDMELHLAAVSRYPVAAGRPGASP